MRSGILEFLAAGASAFGSTGGASFETGLAVARASSFMADRESGDVWPRGSVSGSLRAGSARWTGSGAFCASGSVFASFGTGLPSSFVSTADFVTAGGVSPLSFGAGGLDVDRTGAPPSRRSTRPGHRASEALRTLRRKLRAAHRASRQRPTSAPACRTRAPCPRALRLTRAPPVPRSPANARRVVAALSSSWGAELGLVHQLPADEREERRSDRPKVGSARRPLSSAPAPAPAP